MVNKDYQDYHN